MLKKIEEVLSDNPSISPIIKEIETLVNKNKPNGMYKGNLEITFVADREDFTYDYPLDSRYDFFTYLSDKEPTKEITFEDDNGENGAVFVDDSYNIIAYIYNLD